MSRFSKLQGLLVRTAAAAGAQVLVAGCTGTPQSQVSPASTPVASAAPSGPNDADRHFVDQLLPRHDQAVVMSEAVLTKKSGVDSKVQATARRIAAAQKKELETITTWSTRWLQAPIDDQAAEEHAAEEGPNHHRTEGLMTEGQMNLLVYTDGPIKQEVYLEGMVKNHQSSIAIAETEMREGRHSGAVALAQRIVARQQSDLAQLRVLQAG